MKAMGWASCNTVIFMLLVQELQQRKRENGINGKLSPNRVFLARVTEGLGPGQGGAFL